MVDGWNVRPFPIRDGFLRKRMHSTYYAIIKQSPVKTVHWTWTVSTWSVWWMGLLSGRGAHRARAIQSLHATRVSPAFKGGTGGSGKVRNSAQLLVTTLTQWSGRGSKKCSVGPCDCEAGGRDGIRWWTSCRFDFFFMQSFQENLKESSFRNAYSVKFKCHTTLPCIYSLLCHKHVSFYYGLKMLSWKDRR